MSLAQSQILIVPGNQAMVNNKPCKGKGRMGEKEAERERETGRGSRVVVRFKEMQFERD